MIVIREEIFKKMSQEKIPVSLKEHLKRDMDSFRQLKGKQRLLFLWDYYKLPIAILLTVIIAAGTLGKMLWEGQKPRRLQVCVVLNTEADCSPWFDTFVKELKKDGKKGEVDLNLDQPFDYDNQYYYIQELEVMTTVSSYRMDIAICNEDLYSYLLALNACLPLDEGLPKDLYEQLAQEDRIDHAIANLQIDEYGQTHEEDGIEGDYGVRLNGTDFSKKYNTPENPDEEEQNLYAVILSNTDHMEDCITLLKTITDKE